jgi:uncharacterized protein with HEPN domain
MKDEIKKLLFDINEAAASVFEYSNPLLVFCGIFFAYVPYSGFGYLSVSVCVCLRQKNKIGSVYLGERRDFSGYNKNKMLRRAVEREFEIIGEAMSNILKIEPEFPIRHARRIVDLRNLVIHGYDQVDHAVIWGIISRDLPDLKNEVMKLLNQ